MDVNWDKYRDDALRAVREMGLIPIVTDVKPELASIVSECVFEALLRKIKNVTVLIDSNGGETRAGVGIANALSLAAANGVEVTGLVLSRALSAGFMILQSCKNRVACRGACLMMHWGGTTLRNDDFAAIMRNEEEWVLEEIRSSRLEMIAMFVKRSGLEERVIRQMCDRETSLYPEKALDLHLLDRISDARDFKITLPNEK